MSIKKTFSQRLKIFTYDDMDSIPGSPGTYAWFFPLHLFNNYDHVQDLADCFRKVFAVDSLFVGESRFKEKEYSKNRQTRSWQTVSIKSEIHISPDGRLPSDSQEIWEAVKSEPQKKKVFVESLLAASLFMPPLYIGKSNDLKARYKAHIKDSGFNERFTAFSLAEDIPLQVHDLIFACLSLDVGSEEIMSSKMSEDSDADDSMNYLLEHILMKAATPPFSKK
jgi:hypothetical protein